MACKEVSTNACQSVTGFATRFVTLVSLSSPYNIAVCTRSAFFSFVLPVGSFIVSELVFTKVPRLNPFVEHDVEFFVCAVFGLRQSEVCPYIS